MQTEKDDFLAAWPAYGYRDALAAHGGFDAWHDREFRPAACPRPRIDAPRPADAPVPLVYADHAGATLGAARTGGRGARAHGGQPAARTGGHGPASARASELLENARRETLRWLCGGGRRLRAVHGGATAAIRLVGDAFPWAAGDASAFAPAVHARTSVLGVRPPRAPRRRRRRGRRRRARGRAAAARGGGGRRRRRRRDDDRAPRWVIQRACTACSPCPPVQLHGRARRRRREHHARVRRRGVPAPRADGNTTRRATTVTTTRSARRRGAPRGAVVVLLDCAKAAASAPRGASRPRAPTSRRCRSTRSSATRRASARSCSRPPRGVTHVASCTGAAVAAVAAGASELARPRADAAARCRRH